MNLKDKVAIVTGSDSGIGAEICCRFAALGAQVVVNYRTDRDGAQGVLSDIEAAGSKGMMIQADLSHLSEIQKLVEKTIDAFGQVDILVNNAGLEQETPFLETTEEDYDQVLNVNLKAVFFMTQTVVRHLRQRQSAGRIINISSVHDELSFPGYTTYCASKGGVQMITRNLAVELGAFDITVNSLSPGAIATPMNKDLQDNPEKLQKLTQKIPLGRLGKPEDVASMAAFLASDAASYITGATFYIDGGLLWQHQE